MDNYKSTQPPIKPNPHLFPAGMLMLVFLLFTLSDPAQSQAQQQSSDQKDRAPHGFWSEKTIGLSTARNRPAGTLNSTVLHSFGMLRGGTERFFGLDDGANTCLGLDYGVSDKWSVGIGRMTFDKVVDLRTKVNLHRQGGSGGSPVDIALKVSTGISTLPGRGFDFSDRLSYFASLMAARTFGNLALQLSPMVSHFNLVNPDDHNQLFGLGVSGQYTLSDRLALSFEYLPVVSRRNPGTADALSAGLTIRTGGHLFQLFLASTQWHTEAYIMANNQHRFWEGDIRLGFNINRVFWRRGEQRD